MKIDLNDVELQKKLFNYYLARNRYIKDVGLSEDFKDRTRPHPYLRYAFLVAANELTRLSWSEMASAFDKDHAILAHAMEDHEVNMRYCDIYPDAYEKAKYYIGKHVNKFFNIRYIISLIGKLSKKEEDLLMNSISPISGSGLSKYRGITFDKHKDKWQAYIKVDKKKTHVGYFDNEEDAFLARHEEVDKLLTEYEQENN